jgi:hypothetical protein
LVQRPSLNERQTILLVTFTPAILTVPLSDAFCTAILRFSKFDTLADIKYITERFDSTSKRLFGNGDIADPVYIQFAGPNDKDLSVGIRAGKLKLEG